MRLRTLRLIAFIAPIVVCACGWLWWPHAKVSASIQEWVASMEVYPDYYSTPESTATSTATSTPTPTVTATATATPTATATRIPDGGEFHLYLPGVATE